MSRPIGFAPSLPTSIRSAQQRQQQRQSLEETLSQLSPEQQALVQQSPHIGQVFACGRDLVHKPIFLGEDRVIRSIHEAPQLPYYRRTSEIKTVVHSGQSKLLITEIEFLTQHAQPGDIAIYAGAAPGTHQYQLQLMFPFITFILYDPHVSAVEPIPVNPDPGLGGRGSYLTTSVGGGRGSYLTTSVGGGREIYQEFFTHRTAEQLAHRFAGRRILFLSDIRRHEEILSSSEIEQIVQEDMTNQHIWVSILNPVAFMLKFRPKYGPGRTKYLGGLIYVQPWAGITSSETRLVGTDRYAQDDFSNEEYENALFYHNTITRTTYFEQVEGLPDLPIGCRCYDCSAELFILGQYLARFGTTYVSSIGTTAEQISEAFQREFSRD